MTPHTPSGQQAVEPVLSAAETADRLEAWAREMLASTPPKTGALHLLDAVHYLRTAAPTAPSTAAGELAFVCGCGWDGSYADLNETVEGMTCPKCRLGRNLDCAAALATPPAQGVEAQEDTPNADEQRAAFEALLGERQKRVEALHDLMFEAREIVRKRLKPESSGEDRQLYETLSAAIHNLSGDPFDMHMRAALAAQEGTGNG